MRRKTIISLFALFAVCTGLSAAEPFVTFSAQADALPLNSATIGYSQQEYEGVKIAIQSLQTDMLNVLGEKPQLMEGQTETSILIGTLGKNPAIDKIINEIVNSKSSNSKYLGLKGKREKYIITTVGQQIVIAGSDRRGTIYGIYELSRQLGVLPWYWWADAPIAKHDKARIRMESRP